MAKTTLPTNYVDDVLNGAMDGKRRYREIPNADGTISLEDVTTYNQVGSNFGASQLNLMSDNINQSFDANKMLKTMDEVNAVTQEGYGVDALVVKQFNDSLGGLRFGTDGEGNYGYFGADDSLIPFKRGVSNYVVGKQVLRGMSCSVSNVFNKGRYTAIVIGVSATGSSAPYSIYVGNSSSFGDVSVSGAILNSKIELKPSTNSFLIDFTVENENTTVTFTSAEAQGKNNSFYARLVLVY